MVSYKGYICGYSCRFQETCSALHFMRHRSVLRGPWLPTMTRETCCKPCQGVGATRHFSDQRGVGRLGLVTRHTHFLGMVTFQAVCTKQAAKVLLPEKCGCHKAGVKRCPVHITCDCSCVLTEMTSMVCQPLPPIQAAYRSTSLL